MSEHTTNPRPLDIVTPFISSSYTKKLQRPGWRAGQAGAQAVDEQQFLLSAASRFDSPQQYTNPPQQYTKADFKQERISDERDAVLNRFLFTCWLKSTLSCSLPEQKKGKVKENNQKHMKEVCFA